jgi:hypothetical protein
VIFAYETGRVHNGTRCEQQLCHWRVVTRGCHEQGREAVLPTTLSNECTRRVGYLVALANVGTGGKQASDDGDVAELRRKRERRPAHLRTSCA